MPPGDDEIGRVLGDVLRRSDIAPNPCEPDLIWREGRRQRFTRLTLAGSGTAACFVIGGVALGLTIPGHPDRLKPPAAVASSALPSPMPRPALSSRAPELHVAESGCGAAPSAARDSRLPILPECIAVPVTPPESPCAAIPSPLTDPALIVRGGYCYPRGVLGPSAAPS
jgi:hypothetical protein